MSWATNDDLLIKSYPTIFHMAEDDSWPNIAQHGLLSTSALVDLYEVPLDDRIAILSRHRPANVVLSHAGLPEAIVRDQMPMDDRGLVRCLEDGLAPADWYELLNRRTFFWPTERRLLTLLRARAYRNRIHTVLHVSTAELLHRHRPAMSLSQINSGATKPIPRPRGIETFRRIDSYPLSERIRLYGIRGAVAEVAVDDRVPDIAEIVTRVERRRGSMLVETLYPI